MTDDNQQHALLDALRDYLQQTDFAHLTAIEQPDLATLFTDLAGLKSEVKTESRHFKTTLDTLSEALTQLKTDNQALVEQLASHHEHLQQQKRDVEKALLLEFVDIYERLHEGHRALQNYRPQNGLFNHTKAQDLRFIDSLRTGQDITLKRLEQLLQRRRITVIECVGKAFDAHTMISLEIDHDPQQENGVVLEELRKGFLFEGQVLRLAEVKVNKH